MTGNSADAGKEFTNITVHASKPCEEIFKDRPSALSEFDSNVGTWWCPDIDEYTLAGQHGYTLFYTIKLCPYAQEALQFDISECETDDEVIYAYADGMIQARTKYVGQYFNIDNYIEEPGEENLKYIGYQ